MEFSVQLISALDSTLRLAAPLILCAMAGLFSERSGIVDIGLEGKMLVGAFAAAAMTAVTGSVWFGLLAAVLVSIMMALLHGFACITHKGDQVVSGLAINILAAGLTVVLGIAWFRRGGQTPSLNSDERFGPLTWPFSEAMSDVPILGPVYAELLSGHNLLLYVALMAVPLTAWIVFKTRFGLRLRAVGENPQAVDTAGISVAWLRYRAVIMAGLLCGLAGAYLSIALGAGFIKDMSAGKGYIALAALIFGKWRPFPALFACLLFGFLEAVATRMQGVQLPVVGEIDVQLMQALPYILTVILLAGFIGRAIAPKAIGTPYSKDRA
jgi:simple sugar transport system permease protein